MKQTNYKKILRGLRIDVKVVKKHRKELKQDLNEIAKYLTTTKIKSDRIRIKIENFLIEEILRISDIIKGFNEYLEEEKRKLKAKEKKNKLHKRGGRLNDK